MESRERLLTKEKKWYSLKEAAETLRCSERKVRYYLKDGRLSRNLESRHIRIPAAEIEKFTGRVTLGTR